MLKSLSFKLGLIAGRNPFAFIFTGFSVLTFCLFGFFNSETTSEPQDLWVPPSSRANIEQEYVESKFGKFFRINTIFLTPAIGENQT
jgi:hypothetical protein